MATLEAASTSVDAPPTANLYVEMPSEGVLLQMCVMRPDAPEVCAPLPFLMPAPPAVNRDAAELASSCPALQVLAGTDVVAREPEQRHEAIDPVPERRPHFESSAARSAFLRSLANAALHGDPLPTDVMNSMGPEEWEEILEGAQASRAGLLDGLSADQLQSVAIAARSARLCDMLLQTAFPRLLAAERTLNAAVPDASAAATAPLPGALGALLLTLLRGSSYLRLDAQEYDREVVQLLRASSGGLGGRAAAQAALVYAVAAQEGQRMGQR